MTLYTLNGGGCLIEGGRIGDYEGSGKQSVPPWHYSGCNGVVRLCLFRSQLIPCGFSEREANPRGISLRRAARGTSVATIKRYSRYEFRAGVQTEIYP